MDNRSLFERLGGADGIGALVDDIVALHAANPAVKARFAEIVAAPERLAVVKRHTCAFLAAGTGGPAAYAGRSMREAHRGMMIEEAEFAAVLDDIRDGMRGRGIDARTQEDVLAIARSLAPEIVAV